MAIEEHYIFTRDDLKIESNSPKGKKSYTDYPTCQFWGCEDEENPNIIRSITE